MNQPAHPPSNTGDPLQYQKVNPKYKMQLCVELTLQWLVYLIVAVIAMNIAPAPWNLAATVVLVLLIVVLVVAWFTWAPRRYQLTGYAFTATEVHYRTGALWRKQVSVPVNRIQHVEISQGVIERGLELAKLVLYTAGGSGSDLAIPGLPTAEAERLRSQLLGQVTSLQEEAVLNTTVTSTAEPPPKAEHHDSNE